MMPQAMCAAGGEEGSSGSSSPHEEGEKEEEEKEVEEVEAEKKNIVERASEAAQQWLTSTYGRYNKQAGEKTGVEYGQAWRTAFSQAAAAGAKQVRRSSF